jgi:protein-disulfide isomerase
LSPDSKFLLAGALDLSVDPLEEERKEHRELTAALTKGKFPELGAADSPVTIVEFADFQCPFCQHAAGILKDLQSRPEGRKVRVVFRHFPLSFHPWAQIAAEAAACINLQSPEHFWEIHDWIFENQKTLSAVNARARLLEVAERLQGIDVKAYQSCVETSSTSQLIKQDVAAGAAHDVRGTPTFFINGRRMAGIRSLEDLLAIIADAEKEESTFAKTAQSVDSIMQGSRR